MPMDAAPPAQAFFTRRLSPVHATPTCLRVHHIWMPNTPTGVRAHRPVPLPCVQDDFAKPCDKCGKNWWTFKDPMLYCSGPGGDGPGPPE